MNKIRPIRDKRYTITREYTGESSPMYVVRFCDEFIASSKFYSAAVVRAVGDSARRRGALVVTEIKP